MGYVENVRVKNFQSIEEVSVEFAPGLTTIVGPSSSGKSALLRAIKTLVHNTNKPQVRAGKQALTVEARINNHDVSVTRGKSKSAYTLDGEDYTKAGTTTPEPIAKALNLSNTDPDAHFGFQFDKPYLLAETGSTLSAVLAKLTQANVLREAVREGARLAQQHTAHTKARRADVEQLKERLRTDFADLPAKHQALTRAKNFAAQADEKFSTASDLVTMLDTLATVRRRVDSLKSATHVDEHTAVTTAQNALESAAQVEKVYRDVVSLRERLEAAHENVARKAETVEAASKHYTDTLHTLGTCPTCGQTV